MWTFFVTWVNLILAHSWWLAFSLGIIAGIVAYIGGWIAAIPIVGEVIDAAIGLILGQALAQFVGIVLGVIYLFLVVGLFIVLCTTQFLTTWISLAAGWLVYELLKSCAAIVSIASPGWTGGQWAKFGVCVGSGFNIVWQFLGVWCHAWFVAGCILAVLQAWLYVSAIQFVRWCKKWIV